MNNLKVLRFACIFLFAMLTVAQFVGEVVFVVQVVFYASLTIFFIYIEVRQRRWLLFSKTTEKSILLLSGSILLTYGIYHLFQLDRNILLGISICTMGIAILSIARNNLRIFDDVSK